MRPSLARRMNMQAEIQRIIRLDVDLIGPGKLAVRAVPSATSRQGTSHSLLMRCFFASSFNAASLRPPATTS